MVAGQRGREIGRTADYSSWARLYAAARPTYPEALFEYLVGLLPRRELAWDCATGSGQAAGGLAERFDRVVASDRSLAQIREAVPHPRVRYRVATAERSALPAGSVDLVTVAAAAHWFDLDAFGDELRRVVRPGGVVAVWTYHVAHLEGPVGDLLLAFYRDVVGPYFPPGAALVDRKYEGLRLPGSALSAPEFRVEAEWGVAEVLAFVRSWSGTQAYLEAHGRDPSEALGGALAAILDRDPDRRRLRWPLYLRASRL